MEYIQNGGIFMKSLTKRLLSLSLCLVICLGTSIVTQAASAYKNHYTNGSTSSSFQITTTSSISQFTVQTQDFPSDSSIAVEVWNSNGSKQLSTSTVWLNGNEKINNQVLNFSYPKGTYTIKYDIHFGGSGYIGVWLY